MTATVRPAPTDEQIDTGPAVIATISIDIPLTLARAHAIHRRIDTVVRDGSGTLVIVQGAPSATPIPATLPAGTERIAHIHVPPVGVPVLPGSICMLNICCVCGTPQPDGRIFYTNANGQLFCWPCADGNRPTCPLGDACKGTYCEAYVEHGLRPDPMCDCHQPPVRTSNHVRPAAATGPVKETP